MRMRFTPLLAFATLSLAGVVALGVSASQQDPQDPQRKAAAELSHPDGRFATNQRALPEANDVVRTLLLTVELDARGARTVMTTRKPDEFVQPRSLEAMPFGWIVRDANGVALAEGGFDPGLVDLDPAHFGQPGEIRGDIHIPTATATLVAIPDFADYASVDFFRRNGAHKTPFGSSTKAAAAIR